MLDFMEFIHSDGVSDFCHESLEGDGTVIV